MLKYAIAQEVTASDYIYCKIFIMPSRMWNNFANHYGYDPSANGPDVQGVLLLKLNKSDLNWTSTTSHKFLNSTDYPQYALDNFHIIFDSSSRINMAHWQAFYGFTEGNTDGGADTVTWFFNHKWATTYTSTFHKSVFTSNTLTSSLTSSNSYTLGALSASVCTYTVQKSNGKYYFLISYLSCANRMLIFNEDFSLNKNLFLDNGWDMDGGTVWYGADSKLITSSDGTEIFLLLRIDRGNNDSLRTGFNWRASYIDWDIRYLSLNLSSATLSEMQSATNNSHFFLRHPENNVIATFFDTGLGGLSEMVWYIPKTSGKTLYKNSFKFVVHNNYIIYAYNYPGKTTNGSSLVIGCSRFRIDENHHVQLLTKTQFTDNNDLSFITDCQFIYSMDVKNGHLWIVYLDNADPHYVRYFHAMVDDVIAQSV